MDTVTILSWTLFMIVMIAWIVPIIVFGYQTIKIYINPKLHSSDDFRQLLIQFLISIPGGIIITLIILIKNLNDYIKDKIDYRFNTR